MTAGKWVGAVVLWLAASWAQAQTEVRLAVHKSFDLPKEVLAQFERSHQVRLTVIKVGSGNEMLNKLILTRANPIADAVYGLDNSNIAKARQFGILAAKQPAGRAVRAALPGALAVDYGYVAINYDKAWFQQHHKALPKSLADLASPAYKNLLVVPSPATSSTGLGFLMANIGGMGVKNSMAWWAKMRQNGVKITKGWSDAYYTDFTLNGGSRPMVVGYATSPAAEVHYSKGKYTTPPTGNLFLPAGVFRQVEGAAVLNKARQPVLAAKLVQYLQSNDVQKAVPESMWVYPAVTGTPVPSVFAFTPAPRSVWQPQLTDMSHQQQRWVSEWVRTVLR